MEIKEHPAHKIYLSFQKIEDPRRYNKRHSLSNIMVLSLFSLLVGCEDFCDFEEFCKGKRELFKEIFNINEIPSHDTFCRVFSLIDHKQFELIFRELVADLLDNKIYDGLLDTIALDGKTIPHAGLHIVSAYSTNDGLVLGSLETGNSKKNELHTMVKLVAQLKLEHTVVTTDAMGCNDALIDQITKQKCDYVISLKGNQGNALENVVDYFKLTNDKLEKVVDIDKSHGAIIEREYEIATNIKGIDFNGKFANLKSIIKSTNKKTNLKDNKVSEEIRYFISSLTGSSEIQNSIRKHWFIENKLHWQLDVSFHEDGNITRDKNCQKNLNILRKIALNYIKHNKTTTSLSGQIRKNRWDESILKNMLQAMKKYQ